MKAQGASITLSANSGQNDIHGAGADIKIGNAFPLKNIPVGTVIHCIELKPGKGGQLARAAAL